MSFPTTPTNGKIYKDYVYNSTDEIWEKVDPSKYFPIGFIHTQYPGKPDPSTLGWYGVWENKSSEFAGDFFRAEGGNANAFDGGEQFDALQGHYHQLYQYVAQGSHVAYNESSMLQGNYPQTAVSSPANPVRELTNDGTNGDPRIDSETRPINQTVRIWERVL